jgi:DNA-binding response OmpR family regulator
MNNQTILVVEDEKPLLDAIKMKLEKSGFKVMTARSMDQAEEYLSTIPDVKAVWLDHYLLGKGSGLDFVAKLKNNDTWKTIPIFVVSNTASPDKVTSYISLGVDKYYTKSDYRLDQIIADIKEVLK